MKSLAFTLLLLIFIQKGHSQRARQYNNWYFGYGAGLTWNNGFPQPLVNNAFTTDEGCAAISDSSGNILFYTNGETAYNRNNIPMPNGSGLYGSFSGTQTALIVQDIMDDSLYYLFTTPAAVGFAGGGYDGVAYSIIDMRLDNTLGDVSVKNVKLVNSVVEKLTAVRHRNGIDTWVIAHKWNTDEYYAYLVTCDGIKGPVISNAGRTMADDGAGFFYPAIGCLAASPRRNKLAATWSSMNSASQTSANLDILDFDNSTGIITTDTFDIHPSSSTLDVFGYGLAFSNDNVLYLSEYGLDNGVFYSRIMQYDLKSPYPAANEIEIANNSYAYGTLQMGPDGDIYCAKLNGSTYLSCIRNPDGIGSACDFIEVGVTLGGKPSTWGLPNNWDLSEYREPYNVFLYEDTVLCNQNAFPLNATYAFPLFDARYEWDDGSTDPLRYVTSTGIYDVKIFVDCDTLYDTVSVRFDNPQIMLPEDQSVCEGDSLLLDAYLEGSQYLWNNGSTDSIVNAKLTGTYMVILTDSLGCQTSDTVTLDFRNCVCRVFIPNTFTANDDGKNDRFSPVSYCDFLSYEFNIYNRWGQNIFQSTDMNAQWNGGDNSPTGIYCWTLRYSWFDGRGVKKASKTGTVALLR